MRAVIIHYHLFKNAGSTVDAILGQNVPGDSHGHLEGPYPWSTVTPGELTDFVGSNSALKLVSSHQARLPVPQVPDISFLPVLFLRHPIDRFASVYEYERRQPADSTSPSAQVAKETDLAGFARWVLDPSATAVCRNFHVVHLAGTQGDMRTARATHEDYFAALSRLEQLPFFGIVDLFDESLAGLQHLMRPHFGKINTEFAVENASPGRPRTLDERLAQIQEKLGPTLYRGLLEVNALDMLLYGEATKLFAAHRAKQIAAS